MFQNYIKIAVRNLLRNKSFSFINLFGLTIGLACCLLIGLYIWNELSFDKYHEKSERIWRFSRKFFNKDGSEQLHLGHLAPPFGPLLKNDFPDMEEVTRLLQTSTTVRIDERFFSEDQMFYAEPNVFQVFDIPLQSGNPASALNEPYTLLLNETTAQKYFGKADPINQTLRFSGQFDLKVTGVFRDFPYNSHFHPAMLVSFSTLNDTLVYGAERLRTNWGNNSFSTFALLPKNYPARNLEAQFPAFLDKHMQTMATAANNPKPSSFTSLHLEPLTDIHLKSHLDSEIEENGDIRRVYIFSIIALFVLLIACINYMNLSTARSAVRAKEIGVRKVVGALQREILLQFLSESILLSLLAATLAFGLARITLPLVNKLLGQELLIPDGALWAAPGLLLLLAGVTGLLAGLYPAFYLSALKPLSIIKSENQGRGGGAGLRKVLVVGQFAVSVALIIATVVVFRQLQFLQDKKLGLNKDHIVTAFFYNDLAPQYESFRNEILSNPAIKNVTRSSRLPSGRLLDSFGSAKAQLDTDSLEQSQVDLKFVTVDHRFAQTYGLEMAAGRFYLQDFGSDRTESFIVNESAAKMIGWKSSGEAVDKRINYGNRDARIVGILKDFNFESLHQEIQPMIFYIPRDSTQFSYISFKMDGANIDAGLAQLKSTWQKFLPEYPFDYQFLDEQYGQLYEAEQRQGRVFIIFALLAILIGCLGLFGLTTFVVQQRVKEIGIRKVLGATVSGLLLLISKDFLKLVGIALVIASPIAWYFMHQWLQDFAYRIDIGWWVFALAGLVAASVAFLTVSFESLKAALANPINSLRNE